MTLTQSSATVQPPQARSGRFELCVLFGLQAHAIALWYVPFSNVLKAHALGGLTKYAFACASIASFISPMLSGTLADHHFSAERVLRWLSVGVGSLLALTFLAIERGWGGWWVLAIFQLQQLCAAPSWGLSTAIVLARLREPAREFGPVRVWATFGWMLAGPLLSFGLKADASTLSGFLAAAAWFGVAAFTFRLPSVAPMARKGGRRWRDLLGLDALTLLRDQNHRAVFLSAALFSIPLAAFYPFTVLHLRDLGESRVSAAMSLGQISEAVVMLALAPLLARFRLKTIFTAGIAFGLLRYVLFAANSRWSVLAGIALHGACFSLFTIPAQIYMERRVDPQFRVRAQALLTLMMSGLGALVGSLGCGWLLEWCAGPAGAQWTLYWSILCGSIAVVLVFFLFGYGDTSRLGGPPEEPGRLSPAAEPMAAPTPE